MKAIRLLFILGLLWAVSVFAEEAEDIRVWNIAVIKPSMPWGYSLYVRGANIPFPVIEITFLQDETGLEGQVWITARRGTEDYESWIENNAIFLDEYISASGVKFKKYITTFGHYSDTKFVMFTASESDYFLSISSHGWWFGENEAEDVFTPFFLKVIVDGFGWSLSSNVRGLGG